MPKPKAPRARSGILPIIGAKTQGAAIVHQLERRDPKTGQLRTAFAAFRDRYAVGQTIRWGYGAKWTVIEVRTEPSV